MARPSSPVKKQKLSITLLEADKKAGVKIARKMGVSFSELIGYWIRMASQSPQ